MNRLLRSSLVLVTALAVAPLGAAGSPAAPAPAASHRSAAVPELSVRTVARGLQTTWDVQQAPGGRLVVSERDRARISVVRHGKRRTLARLGGLVWVSGETGLMSLAVDAGSRTLWACHGATTSSGHEVRVTRWRVDRKLRHL